MAYHILKTCYLNMVLGFGSFTSVVLDRHHFKFNLALAHNSYINFFIHLGRMLRTFEIN
jgi:hypothetical protein